MDICGQSVPLLSQESTKVVSELEVWKFNKHSAKHWEKSYEINWQNLLASTSDERHCYIELNQKASSDSCL